MALEGIHYRSASAGQQAIIRAIDDENTDALRAALRAHGNAELRARIDGWMPIIDEVMVEAVFEDNRDYLRLLLDAGLDPNFVKDEAEGRTLLMEAAMSDPVTCKLLLDCGANHAVQDCNGHTALFYAADLIHAFFDEEQAIAIAAMLREAGASPDIEDRHGKRAAYYAEESSATLGTKPERRERFIAAFR